MHLLTTVSIRGLSVIIFLIFVSTMLTAQGVVIKEKVTINPRPNHTLQANTSSSGFPYFSGEVDPKDYIQKFLVFRPCNIICTGTFESAEEIPANILVGIGSNEIAIANRTDTLQVNCGEVQCCLYNWKPCGIFFNVNVSGNISDKLITYTMTGDW